ncbi:4-alpha-monomethylsterol monooxygenase [Acrasis kona]|uniref:4-alpha-monomethylsterol monooxygenase n=1 Tax=Acrasis kona TaxID=1008807 RepID=A0AAW2Z2S7_9EUKA
MNNTIAEKGNIVDQWIFNSYSHLLNTYPEFVVKVVLPFLSIVGSYALFCGFMFLLEYLDIELIKKYKIQQKKFNDKASLIKAVKYLAFNYFVVILPMYISFFSIMSFFGFSTEPSDIPSSYTMVWQTIVFFFLEDFCHYWFHRWLHTEFGYKNIHCVHHEFTAPSALSASYSHPAEVVIQGMGTFMGPILFRPHLILLVIWTNLRQFSAIDSHCGYDFPFALNNILPSVFGGADFHDFHHRTYNGAYSSNFIFWDKWMGTCGSYFKSKEKRIKKQ